MKTDRIQERFISLEKKGQKALIPFVMAGDPDFQTTLKIIKGLEEVGADCIELGLPYSDPLADGPVLQRSAHRALKKGMTLDQYLELIHQARNQVSVPLVGLCYLNPLLQYGWETFGVRAEEVGLDGVVIPDLPVEAHRAGPNPLPPLSVTEIRMVAPTSQHRIRSIVSEARGFVYCVAAKGVTGSRSAFEEGIEDFLKQVRAETNCPIAVGFGLSSPEMIRQIRHLADGFIVGSSLMEQVEKCVAQGEGVAGILRFVETLREATGERMKEETGTKKW